MQAEKTALPSEMVGEVSEIEPMAKSLVIHSNSRVKGAQELNIRVGVTDKTSIKEDKELKRFGDMRIGDKIWVKCERRGDSLIAESIIIKGRAE